MKKLSNYITLFALSFMIFACSSNSTTDIEEEITSDLVVVDVDESLFLTAGLSETITIESRTMSDGSTADCYKIVVTGLATDHDMGPWCPSNISDDASAGGIWLEGGEKYDVDGSFIENLATFYSDSTWSMYDSSTGEITKTESKEDCANAAIPDVGDDYKNYCVECLPSYLESITNTYYIPVTPVEASSPTAFGSGPMSTGPSVRGLAFNGVVFDAPAPVSNILGAYTLAPFDDAGGHINLAAGYHYHAATGISTQIEQTDGHTGMIGYALDGYGMYNYDSSILSDLDESLGHYDETRGYHYHVDYAGTNNFINSLHGVYAN
ncbi:YHYH protein [Polaribacter vadi]|uniref:YHYH protein n=1 Tax=Polaribacter TaxID=52959 RepID=UPI001C0997DF|nr:MULTISPECIES: YHYH protein [Polaribacter]MBU3011416.1 YHYH protein [Polaribacter vadi]MDO6741228.1 YHYH protein [Polaribacter sp. 1_MG-2023]